MDVNPWSWTTKDEIAFVRRLGYHLTDLSFRCPRSTDLPDRLDLLRGYRQTMQLRSNWGRVEPQLVALVVDQEIDAELRARVDAAAAEADGAA